ncbi:hypothetical protein HanPI659440_Chr12g0447391 [Helianthus annuus]|nr:hypothetical protein HanPI659440_Chr12g0447391 [Helianthus annuus]
MKASSSHTSDNNPPSLESSFFKDIEMDSDDLIPGYLIHESYEDTLKAFDQSDHSAKEITERK